MKVSELIAAFDEKYAAAEEERRHLIAEGRKKDANNIKSPFWLNEVIVPLAEYISNRKGKKPYILGPYGIGSKVSITLHSPFVEDGCRLIDFTDAESLTVEPCFETTEDGSIALHFRYETGEVDTTKFALKRVFKHSLTASAHCAAPAKNGCCTANSSTRYPTASASAAP